MKISKIEIFYRIFCKTFIMLSSPGPSAENWGGRLGVFKYLQQHNNSLAYRQRHSVADTDPNHLYRDDNGVWRVGCELGDSSSGLKNRTKSDSVPTNNWLYSNEETLVSFSIFIFTWDFV